MAENPRFDHEAPEPKADGWCYDMSKVVPYKFYMVAYSVADGDGDHKGVKERAYRYKHWDAWQYKDSSDRWADLNGTVYAVRETWPLLDPPLFPENGIEKDNDTHECAALSGGKVIKYRFIGNPLVCSHTVFHAIVVDNKDRLGMHLRDVYQGVIYEHLILPSISFGYQSCGSQFVLLRRDSGSTSTEWRVCPYRFSSLAQMRGVFRDCYMSQEEYECVLAVLTECFSKGTPLPAGWGEEEHGG